VAEDITGVDPLVTQLARGLVSVLKERVDRSGDKDLDAVSNATVVWLADIQEAVGTTGSSVLVEAHRPVQPRRPPPPAVLDGWLDPAVAVDSRVAEPRLVNGPHEGASPTGLGEPPPAVVAAFGEWILLWRQWVRDEARAEKQDRLYRQLHHMYSQVMVDDRATELRLGIGLVTAVVPGRPPVRRHLLVAPVELRMQRSAETVQVVVPAESRLVLEDRVFVNGKGPALARRCDFDDPPDTDPLDGGVVSWLQRWARQCWKGPLRIDLRRWDASDSDADGEALLTLAPALILRKRDGTDKIGFYDAIDAALRPPDAAVPLGLAQLVVPLEPAERRRRLSAIASPVGADPLFPLPTNAEQRDVLDGLRHDSVVVVQGPPGTGKTHTIANLISALLADGQRVLVTSQKFEALQVLSDKLPPAVQQLCVLTPGTPRGAAELDRSIRALSELSAATSLSRLDAEIADLQRRRAELIQQRGQVLTALEHVLLQEHSVHVATARHSGTLRDIAAAIQDSRPRYEWIGPLPPGATAQPPLSDQEAVELLRLLRTATPERQSRARHAIPPPQQVPAVIDIDTAIGCIADAEQLLGPEADQNASHLLANLEERILADMLRHVSAADEALAECGLSTTVTDWESDDWRTTAAEALLARRNVAYWTALFDTVAHIDTHRRTVAELNAARVELAPSMSPSTNLPRLLGQASRLRRYLSHGGRMRRLRPSRAQREATDLLEAFTIDGIAPTSATDVNTAMAFLRTSIDVSAALEEWASAGVPVMRGSLSRQVAQLTDIATSVTGLQRLLAARDTIQQILRRADVPYLITTARHWDLLVRVVRNAAVVQHAHQARRLLAVTVDALRPWAARTSPSAPETTALLTALLGRDVDGYAAAHTEMARTRQAQQDEHRCDELLTRLANGHRTLATHLRDTSSDTSWDQRMADLEAAWTWSFAVAYYQMARNCVCDEPTTQQHLDELDHRLRDVTARLAGKRGLLHHLQRMTEEQRQALQGYLMAKGARGRGKGPYAPRREADARNAMRSAYPAVPAWVMPLEAVAESMAPDPNLFDVVIVDEASQVGVEWLMLLWLAPRVVVIGDEWQCSPGPGDQDMQTAIDAVDHYLQGMPQHRRGGFLPATSLYELMSARVPQVIRLTEHFRSMPEIIDWSSGQFYHRRLVPLRQFGADRLPPLQVVRIADAEVEGTGDRAVNRTEITAIIDQVQKMISDPLYRNRSIGIIALHSKAHARHLDEELRRRVSSQDIERFAIKVGEPPAFQGDERQIILLSMVYDHTQPAITNRVQARRYNVAVTRAEDQLWLFTSIPDNAVFRPDDIRGSLLGYLHDRPDTLTIDTRLDDIAGDVYHPPFESLLQQRVFLELRRCGYAVVPHYPIKDGHIDLVVVGDNGRLAVQCHSPNPHTSLDDLAAHLHRELELRRSDWCIVRIHESEYVFDPQAALQPLWQQLRQRGIEPRSLPPARRNTTHWTPIPLSDEDTDE